MKPWTRWWHKQYSRKGFQFLWGWNSNIKPISLEALMTFNSFEDETRYHIDPLLYLKCYSFQFLWGWNSIPSPIPLRGLHNYPFNSFEDETWPAVDERHAVGAPHFQFLWGWNPVSSDLQKIICHFTFNSFEDETYVRSSEQIWIYSFNSFEDETLYSRPHHRFLTWLSIPLRMKPIARRNN